MQTLEGQNRKEERDQEGDAGSATGELATTSGKGVVRVSITCIIECYLCCFKHLNKRLLSLLARQTSWRAMPSTRRFFTRFTASSNLGRARPEGGTSHGEEWTTSKLAPPSRVKNRGTMNKHVKE